jgi:endonuclease/exonuclease/phosphatase (EEP) superfamily protein YafD
MVILLSVLSILLIASVVISLIRNDYWLFKVFEYPRLQKMAILLVVLALWAIYWPVTTFPKTLVAGLLICLIYLVYKIGPYTILSKKEVKRVKGGDAINELKIFAANVYQENDNYEALLQQIKSVDPDIIFLLETHRAWANAVKELGAEYPYQLLEPLENTYGLLFYSRLPLEDASVKYLVKNDVPSIEATTVLRSGQKIHFWGLHPEPPVPEENLYSTAKDKELMKVALKVREYKLPCFVFGDLNDVAWSHTTELFRKTSCLLDPRRGRGFYSTFSAHSWLIRFPLDYIFCSEQFGLISMKRMPKNGSDHFATFTHLVFQPSLEQVQEAPNANSAELAEANEMAAQPVNE